MPLPTINHKTARGGFLQSPSLDVAQGAALTACAAMGRTHGERLGTTESPWAQGTVPPRAEKSCTESGRPLHFRNLGKAFTKAAEKAKLNPEGKRKLRFHDLRRGCEGPYVVQQLGHSVGILYAPYAGLFNARSQSKKGLAAIQAARDGR